MINTDQDEPNTGPDEIVMEILAAVDDFDIDKITEIMNEIYHITSQVYFCSLSCYIFLIISLLLFHNFLLHLFLFIFIYHHLNYHFSSFVLYLISFTRSFYYFNLISFCNTWFIFLLFLFIKFECKNDIHNFTLSNDSTIS